MNGVSMGVMCGGDADATAAQNTQDLLDALPRMPREYLELSPRDREPVGHPGSGATRGAP